MKHAPLAGLALAAFVVRFLHLSSSAEPTGWDGYSYVVQLERLASEGRLHWPDASWVFWFLAALHVVIPSVVVAIKLGSCVLAALVVPAAWRLGGPTLAVWAACSPTLTHLAGDFPKNLGVVAPLLLVLAWRRGDSRAVLVIAAALAALAHRTGAALLLAVALGVIIGTLASRTRPARIAVALVLGTLAFAALSVVLPGLLHPADLERVGGQLDFTAHVPPPWPYFALRETSWVQKLELLLAWPALVVGVHRFVVRPDARVRTAALVLPLVVCLFPLWRTDSLDLGYRLSLLAPMFAFPLLLDPERFEFQAPWLLALPLVLVGRTGFDAKTSNPPYAEWRALIARIPRPLPKLLIAPQGLNFLYDHETGNESMAWAPQPELDRRDVYRLAWDVSDGEWAELIGGDEPQPTRLGPNVVYVREDVWERFRLRALEVDDDDLHARVSSAKNPSRVRPASLMRAR
ncbi:MAG: hypothetical protein JNM17_10420 [Archangium sp.]|nr:hypothetical protein [Archangium sp.]